MIDRNIVLEGCGVRLEPLAYDHLPQLRARCHDERLWQYTFSKSPFGDDASALAWLKFASENLATAAFAIVDAASGDVIGSTRFFDVEPAHRKLEIGWTFVAVPWWRTNANTACKFLLLRYAFETWGALRVQFKAEAVNLRSRRAIERIGARFEGVLRKFRINVAGEVRDTSFYSILDTEWPAVKVRLLSLVDRSRDTRAAV